MIISIKKKEVLQTPPWYFSPPYRTMVYPTQNCKEINNHLQSVSFYTSPLEKEPFTEEQQTEMQRQHYMENIVSTEQDFMLNYWG